jgi:hypothetical protein
VILKMGIGMSTVRDVQNKIKNGKWTRGYGQ